MKWGMAFAMALAFSNPAAAEDANELDRIPSEEQAPQNVASSASSISANSYIGEEMESSQPRNTLLVPLPGSNGPELTNHLFLDSTVDWQLSAASHFHLGDRFSLAAQSNYRDLDWAARNDLKEAYFEWSPVSSAFLQLGRINTKNGVGYAFNPTDFFKGFTSVGLFTADPSAQKSNRLGAFLIRGQDIFDGGAISVTYAPTLQAPSPLTQTLGAFNLGLGRTNYQDRLLLKANYDLWDDFSPEVLIFHDRTGWHGGMNLTRGFGTQATVYAEWAGGNLRKEADEAVLFGLETEPFFPRALQLAARNSQRKFQNDAAVGISYETDSKVNIIIEYDYHQAGFSPDDWNTWFSSGSTLLDRAESWYLRKYASVDQQPMSRQQIFQRLNWDDAIVRDLSLSEFTLIDVGDASLLLQAQMDYKLTTSLYANFIVQSNIGAHASNFGSNPTAVNVIGSVSYYF